MKDLNMLVWLTQLGMSVAMPLAGFVLLALWLRQQFLLGNWIIFVGCGLGLVCAVDGLRYSLKLMERLDKKKDKESPPSVSFNDHE